MSKKILKVGGILAAPFTGGASLALTGGLAASGLAKSLLGRGGKSATADTTPVMPLPDDDAILQAKKRSLAAQLQRGGRNSTILTDSSNSTLGG